MKLRYYIIALLLSMLILASCKTSFRITVKEPALVSIPQETKRFGVFNSISNENSPEELVAVALGSQQINGNVIAGERAMDGILRGLERSKYLSGEIIPLEGQLLNNGTVNWDAMNALATEKGLDGFFELTELRTISPVGGTVLANAQGQTSAKLDGTMLVTIHIANSNEKYERLSVRHSYKIPISGSTNIIDLLNDMAKKREYYRALGFELGYKAGKMVYPNWVWANRKFYNKGSKVIKRAKPMIQKGNWDIAEKQLLYEVDHHKEKTRGRVLYNLALVKEGQGYIDEAIKYAEQSALECGDKMANEYLRTLKKRKRILDSMK